MNKRYLLPLFISAVVLAGAIALLPGGQPGFNEASGELLLKKLASRINQVDELKVLAAGGSSVTRLTRGDSIWTIEELDSYPADWDRLRSLLANISAAKIVELKTSKPEYYSQLGVEDISAEGADNLMLEISFGDEVQGLIIGNDATARNGQYVRLANQAQTVLINQSLDLSAEPISWADRAIVDIGSSLVADIEISHPDGNRIKLRKVSADETDFELVNLPKGKNILSSWSLNSLGNVFSMLRMEAVKSDNGEPFSAPVSIDLLTFSGLKISVLAAESEDGAWIRITASPPEFTVSGDEDEQAEEFRTQLTREAEAINRRVSGWVYQVPATKFEAMTKRLEQLLEPGTDEPPSL